MGVSLDLPASARTAVEFPVEISLSPLETEEGVLATAAIRDVTERKRFEADSVKRTDLNWRRQPREGSLPGQHEP